MDIEREIGLIDIIEYFKKNFLIIILLAILLAALAFIFSSFVATPKYIGSTTMIVSSNQDNEGNQDDINYSQIQANKALVSTYSEIVKSRGIADKVIENLDLDMDYEEFARRVSIEPVNDTQIISVKVVDTIPERAMDIANETSMIFKDSITEIMKVDNVQILDKANLPEEPSSPKVVRNTIIGVVLGFLIGIVVSLFKEISDTALKSVEDVKKDFDIPVLGAVPDKKKVD